MADRKPLLLVADDDPEILAMLSVRLRGGGYDVLEARDGAEALRQASEHRPDALLLDVMMPERSGWEVARALRSDPELRNTGIIMLTAIGEPVNEMTSPLFGADAYLDKPFDFGELEARLREVLAKRAAKPHADDRP